jgi:chitin synthase
MAEKVDKKDNAGNAQLNSLNDQIQFQNTNKSLQTDSSETLNDENTFFESVGLSKLRGCSSLNDLTSIEPKRKSMKDNMLSSITVLGDDSLPLRESLLMNTSILKSNVIDTPFLHTTTRKCVVELTKHGHLVLDCPVPQSIYEHSSFPESEEFRYMRYTAVTCDPNDFCTEKYRLRQQVYKRETKVAIVVTMYNEDEQLFCGTMMSLMQNITYICKEKSSGWGKDGWKNVVICIVSDGRSKCDQRVLMALSVMGVYQDGVAKNEVNGQPVSAHLYEYTTQVCIDEDLDVWDGSKGVIPVQILFCLKEKNARKINSHRWFFNAFCESLQPDVCILIDVGTKPSINSVYDLWRAFHFQENLGGACGEIMADLGAGYTRLANALVASQNFEYKMSNILDKPLESVFGYISVLPGAFSAYRFAALKDISPGDGPLSKYFHGEDTSKNTEWNMFDANMFLAEDRILCFELFVKRRQNWCLRYVRVCGLFLQS